jgi:hypothetical protein
LESITLRYTLAMREHLQYLTGKLPSSRLHCPKYSSISGK